MGIKKSSVIKNLIYIFISLILIFLLIIITRANMFQFNTICLWFLGFIYLSLFLTLVIDKMIILFHKTNKRIVILFITSIISVIICLILPIEFKDILSSNIIERKMIDNSVIKITALGEKNSESNGYEVCLEGIIYDNLDYNLYNIKLSDNWNFVDGRPIFDKQEQGFIQIELGDVNKYELIFRKNQKSGNVHIQIGEDSYIYDLYSKEPIQRYKLDLSKVFLNEKIVYSNKKAILFYLIYYFIVELIVFSGVVLAFIKLKGGSAVKSNKLENKL